ERRLDHRGLGEGLEPQVFMGLQDVALGGARPPAPVRDFLIAPRHRCPPPITLDEPTFPLHLPTSSHSREATGAGAATATTGVPSSSVPGGRTTRRSSGPRPERTSTHAPSSPPSATGTRRALPLRTTKTAAPPAPACPITQAEGTVRFPDGGCSS